MKPKNKCRKFLMGNLIATANNAMKKQQITRAFIQFAILSSVLTLIALLLSMFFAHTYKKLYAVILFLLVPSFAMLPFLGNVLPDWVLWIIFILVQSVYWVLVYFLLRTVVRWFRARKGVGISH